LGLSATGAADKPNSSDSDEGEKKGFFGGLFGKK